MSHPGTRTCYQNGCRDLACVQANREYARRRYRPDQAAIPARVPAGPARRHLHDLLAAGHTLRTIAAATNVSAANLCRIANGTIRTVNRPTRAAILTFGPEPVAYRQTICGDNFDADWGPVADLVAALAQVLDDRRAPWRRQAACRHPGIPVDVFYVGRGETVDLAKTICGRCPVTVDCDAYATTRHIQDGVWGGRAHKARRPGRRSVA